MNLRLAARLLISLMVVSLCVSAHDEPVFLQQQANPDVIFVDGVDGRAFTGDMIRVKDMRSDDPLQMLLPQPNVEHRETPAYKVTTLLQTGPNNKRMDIVFVGDGYTASEMGRYHSDVQKGVAALLNQEPFKSYKNYLNIYRVDVISKEAGIDNDEYNHLQKDTALDGGFVEYGNRRLRADHDKVYAAARLAPNVNKVILLANTRTYGGVAYSNLAMTTISSDYISVLLHEFGHTFNLADEYVYDNEHETYVGNELGFPNLTIYQNQQAKWARWFDESGVGTYEGGMYKYRYGLYRPADASIMKSVYGAYYGPHIEAMTLGLHYFETQPIESGTPQGNYGDETTVFSIKPFSKADLKIDWQVDGRFLPDYHDTSLDTKKLSLAAGAHTISAHVTDMTPLVRDEYQRRLLMHKEYIWGKWVGPPVQFASTYSSMHVRTESYTQAGYYYPVPMMLVADHIWQVALNFGPKGINQELYFIFDAYGDYKVLFGDRDGDGVAEPGWNQTKVSAEGPYVLRFNDETKRYWLTKL